MGELTLAPVAKRQCDDVLCELLAMVQGPGSVIKPGEADAYEHNTIIKIIKTKLYFSLDISEHSMSKKPVAAHMGVNKSYIF